MVEHLRYYSGYHTICRKRMSIRTLLQRHVRDLSSKNSQFNVSCHLPASLPWVQADRRQLDIALTALTENAIQAMPHGGRLHVTAGTLYDEIPEERCAVRNGGDYVVISISDTGRGMDRNTQARIFEPFFSNKKQRSKTSGLGLCAACGIIKAHGGFIQVRSTPGKGSSFKIYLNIKENLLTVPKTDHGLHSQRAA